jgi:hypothetical protein
VACRARPVIIARREMTLRDWRIVVPIVLPTFPC